jgi:hypothetical protein
MTASGWAREPIIRASSRYFCPAFMHIPRNYENLFMRYPDWMFGDDSATHRLSVRCALDEVKHGLDIK